MLKLDSSLKNDPEGIEKFLEERAQRLAGLQQRQISIRLERQQCESCRCLKIHFKDSGDGFDFTFDGGSSLELNQRSHGRGIALLNTMCNTLRYYGNGSEVMACLGV